MVKEFHAPESLTEASRLKNGLKRSFFLGGGTIVNAGTKSAELSLISLHRLGLNFIQDDEQMIEIGAMTTLSKIAEHPLFADGALAQLKHSCMAVSKTIRNMATIGGCLGSNYSRSDIIPVLSVLAARVNLSTLEGERSLSLDDYILQRAKGTSDLIKSVSFPKPVKNFVVDTARFARSSNDLPTVKAAVSYRLADGRCQEVKMALGGIGHTVVRAVPLELALENQDRNMDFSLSQLIHMMKTPSSDIRGSGAFKKSVLQALLEDMITKIKETCANGM